MRSSNLNMQETVSAVEINLEHEQLGEWVPDAIAANHFDDGFGVGQSKIPEVSSVPVSQNPFVNGGPSLGTVNDSLRTLELSLRTVPMGLPKYLKGRSLCWKGPSRDTNLTSWRIYVVTSS